MAYLREENVWTEPIYLIERHDPLMGGEYGINNVQARQLANRTVYLLERLLREHGGDGSHLINENQLVDDAGIVESKLLLSCPTAFLAKQIGILDEGLRKAANNLDHISGLEQSLYGPLYEALRLSWKFGYPRFAFELFNIMFSMRPDFTPVPLIESIRGDDSIDVDDSSTLIPDQTYVLWDEAENRSVFATIREVLTRKRVILYHTEETTRTHSGVLTTMSWTPGIYGMRAKAGSKYVSGHMTLLEHVSGGGSLVIAHRNKACFAVEILRDNASSPTAWERLPLVNCSHSAKLGMWKSIFKAPGCAFHFRVNVLDDCDIDHLALVSESSNLSVSAIRTPQVVDSDFTIVRYGALYDVPHAATCFDISRTCDFSGDYLALVFGPDTDKAPVWDYRVRVTSRLENLMVGDEYWWRAWYQAQDGSRSNYSGVGRYIHKVA